MTGLRVDRPVRVFKTTGNEWAWKCLCSPPVWQCTGHAATQTAALSAADDHLSREHAPAAALAPVIPLFAACRPARPAVRLATVWSGGGDAA